MSKGTGRKRNIQIIVRLSKSEFEKLHRLTKQSKLSTSAFFRQCIQGITIKEPPSRDYKHLYTEINRIGNNINQIARLCNQGAESLQFRDEILFFLHELYQLLDRHL